MLFLKLLLAAGSFAWKTEKKKSVFLPVVKSKLKRKNTVEITWISGPSSPMTLNH